MVERTEYQPQDREFVAAIVGQVGVGKTTFYNLLCDTDHPAGVA